MAEPTSSGAAGVAGWHAVGGAAGVAAGGAGLAAIVVMCMMTPRSPKEWAVGLISTVVCSVAGGAGVIQYFNLHAWMHSYVGLVSLLGIAFACGLPGWALVRAAFTWMEKRRALDIAELVAEARKSLPGVQP